TAAGLKPRGAPAGIHPRRHAMRLSILFLLLAALHRPGSAQQPVAGDAVKRDLQAAQGTWQLVRYERHGKVWDREGIARDFKDQGRELQLRIEGDKLFV